MTRQIRVIPGGKFDSNGIMPSVLLCLTMLLFGCSRRHLDMAGYFVSNDNGYNSQGVDYFAFKDQSFELLRITDVEDEYGQGLFSIRRDTMTLTFKDYIIESNYSVTTLQGGDPDSLNIRVQVFDKKTQLPLTGANALLTQRKLGATADKNGKVELAVARNILHDTLKVWFIGYTPVLIPIDQSQNNNLTTTVQLTSGYHFYSDGDVLQYRIRPSRRGFSLWIFDDEVAFKGTRKSAFDTARENFIKMSGMR